MKPRWKGHNYQRECITRGFKQKYLGYFLDPGLGKTTVILQLFKMLKLYGKTKSMLVIAPIRVCHLVWPLEVKKWSNFSHLTVNVMHGTNKDLWGKPADIYVMNPDGLPWLMQQLKGKRRDKWPFDMMVCDESTLFKNSKSARFKNIKKFVPIFKRRYILTGTPIPNGYLQLFSQMQIIDEGRSLGTKITHFRASHFRQVGNPQWAQFELREGEEEVINRRIAPFIVRMSADEYLTLPPMIENKIYVDLPPKVKKQYKTLSKDLFLEIDGKEVYPPTAASAKQKLHQMANGCLYENWDVLEQGKVPPSSKRPYFKLHSEKITALKELIDELQGKPLFVAYWYHHDFIEISKAIPGVRVINSKTSEKDALKIEKDWNSGKIQVLLAQPASVAHGLNFQYAGGDICWFSLIYDYEIYDQFIKRLWRQGAVKPIRNHFLMARGTIDNAIFRMLHEKHDNQDQFFTLLQLYQKMYKSGELENEYE